MPGISPTPYSRPDHGQGTFDARDYGLDARAPDNSVAIQAAITKATAYVNAGVGLSTGWQPQAIVFIPAGTYQLRKPIQIDSNYITLRGEGSVTRLAMNRGYSYTPVIIGMQGGRGTAAGAACRPDCFGVLDTSAASASGQRWGFRGNGDARINAPFSHFSHGGHAVAYNISQADAWSETRQLTIDFAIKGASGGQVQSGPIMGIGAEGDSNTHGPYPFRILTSGPNSFAIYVGTQQALCGDVTTSAYTFSTGAATGLQRISVQIDCVSRTVSAFAGGVRLAVSGPQLPAGSSLAENAAGDQFVVNQAGSANSGDAKPDNSYFGLCMSRSIRYTTPGVGQAQARADAGTLNDRYRYFPTFGDDNNCIGYLGFTEDPATSPRMLTIAGGGAGVPGCNSAAWIVHNSMFAGSATSLTRIEDMEIDSDQGYGAAIALWSVLETSFDNVTAYGAQYGIANVPHGANYTIRARRLKLAGTDGCYFGCMSTVRLDDVTCSRNGKVAFRLVGTDLRLDGCYVPGVGNPQYSLLQFTDASYGSMVDLDNVTIDTEGDVYLDCGIRMERSGAGATMGLFRRVVFGTVGNVPLFRLRQKAITSSGPAILDARECFGGFSGPIVEQDGPGWIGTVRYSGGQWTPDVVNIGAARGGVCVENENHLAPPHYGSWAKGGSKFLVRWAADGQYQEIRVARDGAIGSAAPPAFKGDKADQSSPNALASYAVDHTSISATLNGQASGWGNLTNIGAAAMASCMFAGGATLTPPTAWTFRLSSVGALRGGQIAEVTAAGYIAPTLANNSANFPAASAGVKSNATAINFGTFTQAATVQSLVVLDQSGNPWASIQLAQPLNVAAGQAVTIPIGALTFAHTPLPGGQWGCLTDYGWGRLWDFAFGGAALTAPAQFYAALTTAATSRATTSLTEPPGNGYARVACGGNWFTLGGGQPENGQNIGDVTNTAAVAFANPGGSWGNATGAALADAPSAGNVWAVAPLANPASPASGTGQPTFAPGAFLVSLG